MTFTSGSRGRGPSGWAAGKEPLSGAPAGRLGHPPGGLRVQSICPAPLNPGSPMSQAPQSHRCPNDTQASSQAP